MMFLAPRSRSDRGTMPSLFEDLWNMPFGNVFGTLQNVSLTEGDKEVRIEAPVPGIDPKNVSATVRDGVLHIVGKTDEETKDNRQYRASARYSYQVALPESVDVEAQPKAEYRHGMVAITFPKRAEEKGRTIDIKID